MAETSDWLRVRGMGRERFASYVAGFLTESGFTVERTDSTDPVESRLIARLQRPHPAVPASAGTLRFRVYPTGGGAAVVWIEPATVESADRPRLDRFVREFVAHLQRSISTESHASAKVTAVPDAHLPWQSPP
ncbi:MAG: hypothetical protein L3K17_07610 [Thermoplasmata archaeon]|nr:hypothetical protein [Thermoplasmata archaeon]